MIARRTIVAIEGDDTVTIETYTQDNKMYVNINGASCQFSASYPNTENSIAGTIKALKEAVAAL
jgi:hypothetical protein